MLTEPAKVIVENLGGVKLILALISVQLFCIVLVLTLLFKK